MTQYALTSNPNIVTRTADGANTPVGVNNIDSNAYDAWLSEGNTPDPYVAPVVVPPSTPTLAELQAQLATLAAQISALSEAIGAG